MIKICNEEYQEKYGMTSGCYCCGTKELNTDIKEVQFVPGSISKTITLCKACRTELLNVLREHDTALNNVSENIETNDTTPDIIESGNVYASSMNLGTDPTKYFKTEPSVPNDMTTITPNDTPIVEPNDVSKDDMDSKITEELEVIEEPTVPSLGDPEFDIETWVDSLIESNEKQNNSNSSAVSKPVAKVLEPDVMPQTYYGEKLRSLKLISNNPTRYMCTNCELDYDNEDMEYAKKEGQCPYCSIDLTEDIVPIFERINSVIKIIESKTK